MTIKIHYYLFLFMMYLHIIGKLKSFFLFYLFIIIHETAHIIVATLLRVKIKEIIFLSIGMNAQYEGNISSCKEFFIAIAGPIVSLTLAIFLSDISYTTMNLIILITNLIPIYPLDGGRMLRIILIKIFGYKKGMKMYGRILKLLICILIVLTLIFTVYFHNYYFIFFSIYVFLMLDKEIKKERIKLLVSELIGIQL